MRTRLHHLLEEAAQPHALRPALTAGTTLGYAELWHHVRSLGEGLATLGVGGGQRVAIYLDKRVETVATMLATSLAEGVFVPVNPVLKPRQVAHIVVDSGSTVLVTSARRWTTLADVLEGSGVRHVVLVDEVPEAATFTAHVHSYADLVATTGNGSRPTARGVDLDTAAILYTSGSTGRPKGVVLSHRNLLVGAESVSSYIGNTPDDVILAALPLSFDAGLSQVTTALCAGAHVVLANYLLPRDLVRACEEHGVTGLTGVPPLWAQLAEQQWPEDTARRLRYFANTGGRMPATTLKRLRDIFRDARPFLMYGLTEAFRSTYLDPDEVDRRPDSIGKAIPDAEILVLRPDGTPCRAGEEGELVHRGPLVAAGYWNAPELTAERFRPLPLRDGRQIPELAVWSGDTVVADDDGFLYFVGRTDEMLKTSGYRVSPTEIEEAAYETGMVRDAAAVGVPDEDLGHRIVLVVSPPAEREVDAAALLAALRKELPLYMLPSAVVVRRELPRSPNGKFDRVLLRQEVAP